MTRAWSRGRITGASKRLQLLRYPRSKPICATRPVSEHGQPHMRSPLIAAAPRSRFRRAGLRKTRTILENGVSGHGLLRFVYLDPPELIRSWKIRRFGQRLWLSDFHYGSHYDDASGDIFPECHEQFARERYDCRLLKTTTIAHHSF